MRAPHTPVSHSDPGLARALELQRAVGNRAAAQELQRWPSWLGGSKTKAKPKAPDKTVAEAPKTYPATVTIAGEQVLVESKADETEAERIIKDLPAKYGVSVSSAKSLKAFKADYKSAGKEWLEKIKSHPWIVKELKAIEKALKHFAPVLGSARKTSSRKGSKQEVLSVGKLNQSLEQDNSGAWGIDASAMGEYIRKAKNFSMYKHGETATPDYSDIDKQLEATATHEMAHGIFAQSEDDWLQEFDYWLDDDTASGVAGAEAPPTSYGATNVGEDLAESVMFYFVDPERLKKGTGASAGQPGNPCPLRYAFVEQLVGAWAPKKAVKA